MGIFKSWFEVGAVDEFDGDDRKDIRVGTRDIMVLKVEDRFYAVSSVCTHAEALMIGGLVEGFELECPLHGARFDIRTGRNLTPPAVRGLTTYETKVEGGRVYIKV